MHANTTRIQAAAFLLLLFMAQLLGTVHDVSHVSGPDDQACSQCLHGKPKQHGTLAAGFCAPEQSAMPAPVGAAVIAVNNFHGNSFQPRAPPPAT